MFIKDSYFFVISPSGADPFTFGKLGRGSNDILTSVLSGIV